jgi:4-amino-4-deoxy-L-arabinose transferase-like glycosyltransferase
MEKKSIYWIIFLIILLVFVITRIPQLTPTLTDENVYFYMGKLISEGFIPYKDFFHAHPPIKIMLYGLVIKVLGVKFIVLKVLSLIAILISVFFIYWTLVKKNGHIKGLIAVFLFLFTATTFLFSTLNFGHNLTAMFIVISYFYFTQKKYLLSGIFSGIASITGLYVLPLIIVFILVSLFSSIRESKKYLYGFAAIFLGVNILMILVSGFVFIKQVYLFHFLKAESGATSKLFLLRNIFVSNIIITFPLILYFAVKRKLSLRLEEMLVIVYIIFILMLKNPFMFYFVVMFPFAAILGGEGIMKVSQRLSKNGKIIFIILICILFIFSINRTFIFESRQDELNKFNKLEEVAEYVRTHSNSTDTIAGDTYITPLVAIKSNRRISSNIVDVDPSIFKTGIYRKGSVVDALVENKVKFMLMHRVGSSLSQFWNQPEMGKLGRFCSSRDEAIKFTDNNNVFIINECNFP